MSHAAKVIKEELLKYQESKKKSMHKEEIYIDDIHEYDYIKDDTDVDITVHTLLHSDNSEWTDNTKGTVALELIDTGNGVIIDGASINKKEINYNKIEQLHILLRLHGQSSKYQISEPAVKTEF